MAIRVAIIEDKKETREMLSILIAGSEAFTCVAAFEDAEDAMKNAGALEADVILVDIHLPGMSGTQCVAQLKAKHPQVQFVMCTSLDEPDTIFAALQAGATGYITKSTAPTRILEAITDAYNGGAPMSSNIARKVVSFFQQREKGNASSALEKLSAREQEILQYLSKGYRYKEIAATLFISVETVRKHIHNIYEKLQVDSRIDAINKAFPR